MYAELNIVCITLMYYLLDFFKYEKHKLTTSNRNANGEHITAI